MSHSRRAFLELTLKSLVVIGAGSTLQSFTGKLSLLPGKKSLRFALVSDGHFGQPDTPYQELHDRMVKWLNAEKKARGLDFTMVNGDVFHNDPQFLPQAKACWDRLKMPWYVSHGNHDMVDEATWTKGLGMPLHYAIDKGDNVFLVLNTADEKGKYICPDMDWTKEQLAKYASVKNLFVFMHITPFNWTKGGNPCPELVDLFSRQSNLKAVFHGHDHDQDGVKEHEGKYYFFDSHVAGNWGTDYHGYRIVEVHEGGEIITYQMNPVDGKQQNQNELGKVMAG